MKPSKGQKSSESAKITENIVKLDHGKGGLMQPTLVRNFQSSCSTKMKYHRQFVFNKKIQYKEMYQTACRLFGSEIYMCNHQLAKLRPPYWCKCLMVAPKMMLQIWLWGCREWWQWWLVSWTNRWHWGFISTSTAGAEVKVALPGEYGREHHHHVVVVHWSSAVGFHSGLSSISYVQALYIVNCLFLCR